MKVFELYGSSSSILEVEYFEEVGTGLGPTLEFYSLVSREFARRDLKIWRDDDVQRTTGAYVLHPRGLFPAPISSEDIANEGDTKRTHIIRVIGQFVAKAMLDSRIIDMSFNKVFLKLALGEDVPLTIDSLKVCWSLFSFACEGVTNVACDSSLMKNSQSRLRNLDPSRCQQQNLSTRLALLTKSTDCC
jgi:E3 ubiquitin-protein ligase TRIP12